MVREATRSIEALVFLSKGKKGVTLYLNPHCYIHTTIPPPAPNQSFLHWSPGCLTSPFPLSNWSFNWPPGCSAAFRPLPFSPTSCHAQWFLPLPLSTKRSQSTTQLSCSPWSLPEHGTLCIGWSRESWGGSLLLRPYTWKGFWTLSSIKQSQAYLLLTRPSSFVSHLSKDPGLREATI